MCSLKTDLKFIVLDRVCLVFPSLCSARITEFQEAVCGWAALQKEPIVFHLNPCSSKSPHTALGVCVCVCVCVCVMYPGNCVCVNVTVLYSKNSPFSKMLFDLVLFCFIMWLWIILHWNQFYIHTRSTMLYLKDHIHLSVCLFYLVYLSIHLSIHPSIVYPYIYSSIHPSIPPIQSVS